MRAELEVVQGVEHQRFRLQPGATVTIGRSKDASLRIDHTVVSRLHCRITFAAGRWTLSDLESRNGTWMNANRIRSHILDDGDVFTLGKRIAVKFTVVEATGEIPLPTVAEGTCSFCLSPLSQGDGVRDPEGHTYHPGCMALGRLVGVELGGVRIIERISRAGAGHLLRAHQASLNRHVLLHAFDETVVGAGDFRDRLLDEVRAISRLLHPNLLQIHDLIDHKGAVLVVMEHLTGSTLETVLTKRRFVNVPAALGIASQIADALAYAQEQDVFLDRLSTREILVNEENQAKVDLFHPPSTTRPLPPEIAYAAPEVISGGGLRRVVRRLPPAQKAPALRGAVYSVGAILYHMLAGIPPFEGETEDQILPKIMKDTPPALRRVNLKVSPALARVVERATDRDPANRHPDFRALQVDLRKIITPGL